MKVCLVTLGCPKNIVEGESIAGLLSGRGFELTTDISKADAAIVHTCSFISDARNESSAVIKALGKLKKTGSLKRLVVSGCLAQEVGRKAFRLFPEADAFAGTGALDRLPELLAAEKSFACGAPGGLLESGHPRLLSSALPSAYLRIAEGCSHRCSFCLIPQLRGPQHSRTIESITAEAAELAEEGIKEVILVSQDTTSYGRDIYGQLALPKLLKKLAGIAGIRWIRILYGHPAYITDELISIIRSEPNICNYLDLPLQHVSGDILKAMGRPYDVRKTVERLKRGIPELSLRTTFITGFPGETKKDFEELYSFASEGWFDHLGAFEYSPHPALRSQQLGRQVGAAVKLERKNSLMALQKKIVNKKLKRFAGRAIEILVETSGSGRARFQAPEIDGRVYFKGNAKAGSFINVKITGHKGYDLSALTGAL